MKVARCRSLVTLVAALVPVGCAASGVLSRDERAAPSSPLDELEWRSASAADVPGLYSSLLIEGPAAAVLREVHYWFDADGAFSGAALTATPRHEYNVLSGRWRFEDGRLFLSDEGEPARLEVAGEHLRLSGAEGLVVLRRRALP